MEPSMTSRLEKASLELGIIPLVDAVPIVVAQAKGFFERHGLDVRISVEASWASIRDKVVAGVLDGAQMLAPMPLAATLGVDGIGTPMVTALSPNLNGNSIAVSNELYSQMALEQTEPAAVGTALRELLQRDRVEGRKPRVFAHVFPFSAHHYELRYWLAACGIDPDRDLRLEVIPPPQMVQHLRDGRIDGFCVGAPWGAVAESAGVGRRIVSSYQIWNNSPEKVLGVTRDWAARHPNSHVALIAALIETNRWLDVPENRGEAARVLIESGVLDSPEPTIREALGVPDADSALFSPGLVFYNGAASFPWRSHAAWFIKQMQRWNQIGAEIQASDIAAQVYLPQIYRQAADLVGASYPGADTKPEGTHNGSWPMPVAQQALTMGPDRFFDGATFEV